MNPEFIAHYYQIDSTQCIDENINFIDTTKAVIPFRGYLKETGLYNSVLTDDFVSIDEYFIFLDFFRILKFK